jgi:hypothetical protein
MIKHWMRQCVDHLILKSQSECKIDIKAYAKLCNNRDGMATKSKVISKF